MTDETMRSKKGKTAKQILFILLLLLTLIPGILSAQQTLADGDWFERPLGKGVIWRHYQFDNLYGGKQSISYVEVDLNDPDVMVNIPYLVSTRQKISTMIPDQATTAIVGLNGTYFETTGTGGHRTYLRVDNNVIPPGGTLFSAWGYEGAMALNSTGDASIIKKPSGGWVKDLTHPDIIACGPLLIVGNVIQSAKFITIGSHCTSRHPRSAVGITTTNKLILLVADGRTEFANGMTCEELAETMSQLGCPDALNYDGGGSTTLWGKNEPYSGVLNFPSDNGVYDHLGERACSNAIAVSAPVATPIPWDGRITSKIFSGTMTTGANQTVTFTYQNIGTQTWTAADTKLVLARPDTRTSPFYDSATWVSPTEPALMSPATVAPGATATFSFKCQAPTVATTTVYTENFKLTQTGIGRIGPADSEAWIKLIVEVPLASDDEFIIEARAGGQNFTWYTDSGFADSATNCTAEGATATIGSRYGSTYRSVAGAKTATVSPVFPKAGNYFVSVAWGAGSSRKNPITYKVNHASGTDEFLIDQSTSANIWLTLGTTSFAFNAGAGNTVQVSNEDIDVSGSMYTAAFKFTYDNSSVKEWNIYK